MSGSVFCVMRDARTVKLYEIIGGTITPRVHSVSFDNRSRLTSVRPAVAAITTTRHWRRTGRDAKSQNFHPVSENSRYIRTSWTRSKAKKIKSDMRDKTLPLITMPINKTKNRRNAKVVREFKQQSKLSTIQAEIICTYSNEWRVKRLSWKSKTSLD